MNATEYLLTTTLDRLKKDVDALKKDVDALKLTAGGDVITEADFARLKAYLTEPGFKHQPTDAEKAVVEKLRQAALSDRKVLVEKMRSAKIHPEYRLKVGVNLISSLIRAGHPALADDIASELQFQARGDFPPTWCRTCHGHPTKRLVRLFENGPLDGRVFCEACAADLVRPGVEFEPLTS